jgi:hypothetical protein
MEECQRHRDTLRASQQEVISTGFSKPLNRQITDEEMSKVKAMRFECEWRDTRPVIAEAWPAQQQGSEIDGEASALHAGLRCNISRRGGWRHRFSALT